LIFHPKGRQKVFENRVLRIFLPKRNYIIGGWIHNEKFHNLSPHQIISLLRVIKSRNMRWVGDEKLIQNFSLKS
jgi:hypothetical protein